MHKPTRLALNTLLYLIPLGWMAFACGPAKECSSHADCPQAHLCEVAEDGGRKCVKEKEQLCTGKCKTNTDCKDCPDGQSHCTLGFCTKPPKVCPDTCTGNRDCTPCLSNRAYCVEGRCDAKPTCPSICEVDDDCKACTDTPNCIGKKCSAPPKKCPTSCNKDSECVDCTEGKTTCLANVCAAPQTCPSSCLTDAQCTKCPMDSQRCIANTCSKALCPSACKEDTECANCQGGNTSCISGRCGQKGQCPKLCFIDDDCAKCPSSAQRCTNSTCGEQEICPAACADNTECSACPSGRNVCDQGKCSTPGPCPASCTKNIDCTGCGKGFACTQGTCQNPNAVDIGEECSELKPCHAQLRCILIKSEQKSYCFQICSSTTKICEANKTDGRTQCLTLTKDEKDQPITVCLKEALKTEKCGFAGKSQALCKTGGTEALYCSTKQGVCDALTLQTKEGDPCNPDGDTTEPIRKCDDTKDLSCDPNTKKCVKSQTAKEGEQCDPDGSVTGKAILCATGLDCTSFGGSAIIKRCHVTCDPTKTSGECSHNSDTTCLKTQLGTGICLDTQCKQDSDCAFSGYYCARYGNGVLCYPEAPIGPIGYGESCGLPVPKKGCDAKTFCLVTSGVSQGFCTQYCGTSNPCPDHTDAGGTTYKGTCVTANGVPFCIFDCSASPKCPTGLTCQTSRSGSFCLP